MGASFCAALLLTAAVLAIAGAGENGIRTGLEATARLAFAFFWPAYVGGALFALFGAPFQPVKQRARELGLAFASVLAVHLGLVAALCTIGLTPSRTTCVAFGLAAAFAGMLALFSIARLQRLIRPRFWRLLRFVGMNYILGAFAFDFIKYPPPWNRGYVFENLPFAVLAVAAPLIVLAAFVQRVRFEAKAKPKASAYQV